MWKEEGKIKPQKWSVASVKKTSAFIHCDMDCEELKTNLGLPTDDPAVKVWSLFEELKYTFTYAENKDVDPAVADQTPFGKYLAMKNDYLDDCVIKRNLIEYVLIDPATFARILSVCGLDATPLDGDLAPYDGKGPSKDVYYVCRVHFVNLPEWKRQRAPPPVKRFTIL